MSGMVRQSGSRRLSPASRFAVRFIETYRAQVAPKMKTRCRFEPSCSEYGLEAFGTLGFFRAARKTCGRLMRCREGYTGPIIDPLNPE